MPFAEKPVPLTDIVHPWIFAPSQRGQSESFPAQLKNKYCKDVAPGLARCQATGLVGAHVHNDECDNQVCASYIVPVECPEFMLKATGLYENEVNTPVNGLLLARNIQIAFDDMRLCFTPSNPLHTSSLVLKIWDNDIRQEPIWPGSPHAIGEFDGMPLLFPGQPLMSSAANANLAPSSTSATCASSMIDIVAALDSVASTAIPCRRALWYHARLSHEHAISNGWVSAADEFEKAPLQSRIPERESIYGNMIEQFAKIRFPEVAAPAGKAAENDHAPIASHDDIPGDQ